MTYKTIVINLNVHTNNLKGLVQQAISIGERYGGHLVGVHIQPLDPFPMYAESRLPSIVLQMYKDLQTETSEKARRSFERQVAGSGCSYEFIESRGNTDDKINKMARYADLVITSQIVNGRPKSDLKGIESGIILGAPCPVMIIPASHSADFFGRRVMIAWDGSKEVSRAVKSAICILKTSSFVELVSIVKDSKTDDLNHEQIFQFLNRHGVEARSEFLEQSNLSVADRIIERIPKCGADLLIMGAYGHSRLKEMVLGGTTLDMLKRPPVPILLEH